MIEAGVQSQIVWGDGNWIVVDIGFSRNTRSSGIACGAEKPACKHFGDLKERITTYAKTFRSPTNLIIEAPLSVAFSEKGNPKGRMVEKENGKTRYWYYGAGCAVMVAAMYLLRDLKNARVDLRLFEGFVSYKDVTKLSDHMNDVMLLREVVRNYPVKFSKCVVPKDKLAKDCTDKIFSAFRVAGLDFGVPAVIKREVGI